MRKVNNMVDLEIWKDEDSLKISKANFKERSAAWDADSCRHQIAIHTANLLEIGLHIDFIEKSIEALKKNPKYATATFEYQTDPEVVEANRKVQLHSMEYHNENGLLAMKRSRMLWNNEIVMLNNRIAELEGDKVNNAKDVTNK